MIDQIVILAGGLGTRLGNLTSACPKAMIEINGRPFIDWQLSLLKSSGFRKVHICIGHFGEQISNHIQDGKDFDLEISYSSDEGQLLGTGGALRRAVPFLDNSFALTYGDSYLEVDYLLISNYFESSDKSALMTIYKNSDKRHTNNVAKMGNTVVSYSKEDNSTELEYIDYGLLYFNRECLEKFSEYRKIDLSEILKLLINEGRVAAFEVFSPFHEIGSVDGIEKLRKILTQT